MKVNVNLEENSYPVIIENNLLDNLENYIKEPVFTVTNKTVYKLYGEKFKKYTREFIVISDGEKFKSLKTFEYIANKLLSSKIERKDTVLALGGGVIGDIAGFVAASVLRGVNLIQVPTTLLAQVDSSVGGKTAVNTKFGKNLLGAFYQPKLVLIDPTTLETLDNRQIKAGLGEVVKYAFIEKTASGTYDADFTFLNFLENYNYKENMEKIVTRSCQIKADVVSNDEKEQNLRQILNFAHTFAHAFEKLSNYKINHGEAVSIGIGYAFKLALRLSLIDKSYFDFALDLMQKMELKTVCHWKFDPNKIYEAMKSDKKVQNSLPKFVLPIAPSEVMLKADADELLIKEILL